MLMLRVGFNHDGTVARLMKHVSAQVWNMKIRHRWLNKRNYPRA